MMDESGPVQRIPLHRFAQFSRSWPQRLGERQQTGLRAWQQHRQAPLCIRAQRNRSSARFCRTRASHSRRQRVTEPAPNAPKYFALAKILGLGADREWLHKATRTISKNWQRKNDEQRARRASSDCQQKCQQPARKNTLQ